MAHAAERHEVFVALVAEVLVAEVVELDTVGGSAAVADLGMGLVVAGFGVLPVAGLKVGVVAVVVDELAGVAGSDLDLADLDGRESRLPGRSAVEPLGDLTLVFAVASALFGLVFAFALLLAFERGYGQRHGWLFEVFGAFLGAFGPSFSACGFGGIELFDARGCEVGSSHSLGW